MGLHFLKAFLSGLIRLYQGVCVGGGMFNKSKNKLDKSEKIWEDVKRF